MPALSYCAAMPVSVADCSRCAGRIPALMTMMMMMTVMMVVMMTIMTLMTSMMRTMVMVIEMEMVSDKQFFSDTGQGTRTYSVLSSEIPSRRGAL